MPYPNQIKISLFCNLVFYLNFKVEQPGNLRFGKEYLLKFLRLLRIGNPSFSLHRTEENLRIPRCFILIHSNPVEEDRQSTLTCSPGAKFYLKFSIW